MKSTYFADLSVFMMPEMNAECDTLVLKATVFTLSTETVSSATNASRALMIESLCPAQCSSASSQVHHKVKIGFGCYGISENIYFNVSTLHGSQFPSKNTWYTISFPNIAIHFNILTN